MSHYDEASNFSDLSSLDGSDEFGRKLLQHTKDAQRISALTQSHAFSKAKPLPRAALSLDNLERNNAYNPPSYQSDHHPASLSGSTASDPPLNPPRAWGRKGRPNHTWMRHIHDDPQSNIQSSPNIDWADAANDSLYSSAHVSPPQRRTRTRTLPKQAVVEQHDSYVDQWEPDQDFSAASLLVSTPAVPSRSRLTIDQIREREVQTYEARASSSARRQLRQQSTNETVSHTHRDTYAEAVPSTIAQKENIPLAPPQSARSLYKTVETTQKMPTTTPRPAQRKADSLALLKRLSRTPSASPSPTTAKDAMPVNNPPRQDTAWSDKYPKQSTRSLFRGDSPQAPEVVKGPELVYVEQGDSSQAPEVVEIPESAPSEPLVTPSRPIERQLPAKTPVVMGAWIDTPQTARQSNAPAMSQSDRRTTGPSELIAEDPQQRSISEPNLPTSALDAVLQDFRNGKRREDDDPTLGDSTIASLEGVMAPSADNTLKLDLPDVPSAQIPPSNASQKQGIAQAETAKKREDSEPDSKDNIPALQKDAEVRRRWSVLGRSNKQPIGTSACSEQKAQNKDDRALDAAIASASRGSTPRPSDSKSAHQHAQCIQCGQPASVLRAAWNEYWGWFFRRDARAPLGFRLTWLGLACTIFWTWLVTEWILSSILSPPRYATQMRGFGVDPHAPRFPYVLPTMASRPLTPLISPLVSSAAWLWKVVWGQQKYMYYPASPGAWGSAAKVKIGPPGPRSAYYTSSNIADDVPWAGQETTGRAWQTKEEAQRNTWNSWETSGDGSMLDDELII
ncbi:hypothetical protein KCU85_g3500, partial [Aureobasidium melanogenum]